MIVIIDFGMGNLNSIKYKLEQSGLEVTISSNKEVIANSSKLILPGVGHFKKAMENILELRLVKIRYLYDFDNIIKILKTAPGCKVVDERKDGGYITPLEAEGDYTTFISRIRKDNSNIKAINLWVVSDNLLKGAALNTVQILETLIKK